MSENNSTEILNDPYKNSELHPTYLLGYRDFDLSNRLADRRKLKTDPDLKQNIIDIIDTIEKGKIFDLRWGILNIYECECLRENEIEHLIKKYPFSDEEEKLSLQKDILRNLNDELKLYTPYESSPGELDYYLRASVNDYRWLPGSNQAECMDEGRSCGECPGLECHCGFNGWFSPFDMGRYNGVVNGTFIGTGKTQLHDTGFRSEYAQMVSFCNNGNLDGEMFKDDDKTLREVCEQISKDYGIPFFEYKEDMVDYNKENFPDAFDYRGMGKVEKDEKDESVFDQNQSFGRTIVSVGSMFPGSSLSYGAKISPPKFYFQSKPKSIPIAGITSKRIKSTQEALDEAENDEV